LIVFSLAPLLYLLVTLITLITLGTLPIIGMAARYFGRSIKEKQKKVQEYLGDTTSVAEEVYIYIYIYSPNNPDNLIPKSYVTFALSDM